MKSARWFVLLVAMAVFLRMGVCATAADTAKTVTGKSTCGGCTGVTDSCCVLLTDKDGMRWSLTGDSDTLKKAFKQRHGGKSMTATLAGEAKTKKDKDGKEYKVVKVSEVKIDK